MTMHSRSWVAVAGITLTLPLVLGACGTNDGSGTAGGGGSTDDAGNTTLQWSMWSGGTAERDAWQSAADAVTAADPTITVELETSSFDDYFTKMGTRIASGSAPCIVSVQSLRLGALQDGLLPLDDLMTAADFDDSDFVPASMEGLAVNGTQYAIPYDNGPIFMIYNKEMFAAAGVPEPTADWTQEDFLAAAKALTKDGKYGFSAWPGDMIMFASTLADAGVQPVDEDGKLALTDPALVEAATEYASLVSGEGVSPVLSGTDGTFPYNQFIAGNTAMVPDGPWDLLSVQSQSDFTVGAVPLPSGSTGSRTLSAGSGFGIAQSCPVPDEAFAAISTITSTEELSKLAEAGRAFPSRLRAQQPWYDNAPEGAQEALEAASASAEPMRVTKDWAQVSSDLVQYGVPAFNGTATMADVLQQLQEQHQE